MSERQTRGAQAAAGGRKVVGRKGDVEAVPMSGDGVEGVVKRVLVSPADGWDGWVMRLFDLAPGGHTPRHTHDWPHINFVAEGTGELHLDGRDHRLEAGSYAYVPAGLTHQFRNTGEKALSFICIVPEHGDY